MIKIGQVFCTPADHPLLCNPGMQCIGDKHLFYLEFTAVSKGCHLTQGQVLLRTPVKHVLPRRSQVEETLEIHVSERAKAHVARFFVEFRKTARLITVRFRNPIAALEKRGRDGDLSFGIHGNKLTSRFTGRHHYFRSMNRIPRALYNYFRQINKLFE